MAELNHPHLCKVVDYNDCACLKTKTGQKATVSYIAMEYAQEGEIFEWITKTGKFSESEARYYFHQLINALEYMHNQGFYHRDIKPENLLLDSDYNLKIADFGFTTKNPVSDNRKGTLPYMAPEILLGRKYNASDADLFGAAVTLFNLVTRHTPFKKASGDDAIYRYVINGDMEAFWNAHSGENVSDSFKDLFQRMIDPNPCNRLSIKDIKTHRWFKGAKPSYDQINSSFAVKKNKPELNPSKSKGNGRVLPKAKSLVSSYKTCEGKVLRRDSFTVLLSQHSKSKVY